MTANSSISNLQNCLDESLANLSVEKIYNHSSHNFKKSGDKYRGGCPYHDSKSGSSFSVTESNKLFYCHGCGFGGSPVDYVHSLKVGRWEKVRGKDFIDAVRKLASLADVSFPEYKPSPEQIEKARKWERRRSLLQAVIESSQQILWSDLGINARQYLTQKRGISEAGIKDLGLGFLSYYSELRKALQDRGFDFKEIDSVGLKVLEGYITYPWKDANSRPLTIYGRWYAQVLPKDKPKTIALPGKSTKQSPLYLDRALKARHTEIVLVEGVNDAALAQSLELTNVCASVAAFCSGEQIETLKRKGIKKVVLCGDPDSGGENGTASNLNRMIQQEISVYVAPKLPDKLDPDEFILKNGLEAWQEHIDNAEHGFRWQAKRLIAQCGISSDKALEELLKLAVAWSNIVPPSMQKELDSFFWSEIDRHTGATNSETINKSIKLLQEQSKLNQGIEPTSSEISNTEFLKYELGRLIETGATEADIEISIVELAKQSDRSPNDVRRLFKALEKELCREENRDVLDLEINSLLRISQEDIKLNVYIPNKLAVPLEKLATYLGVNNASMLTVLLTVSASLLPINTNLKLIEATDFYAHPILYAGICAESGSGKSPLINVFISSLSLLQQEEEKRYQLQLNTYETVDEVDRKAAFFNESLSVCFFIFR